MHLLQPTQLAIRDLAFERNNQFLFRDLSASLHSGELLQIRGTNGSGKSTLLRIVAGLLESQSGTVTWQNQPINPHQLHYIGHQNSLRHNLTVYENLKLQSALTTKSITQSQLETAIRQVGLAQVMHSQALHLSAGQSRRFCLARLLLTPMPLWILDEPATALDANGQQLLTELLHVHLANGGIAMLATHQPLPLSCTIKTILLGEQHA